MTAAIQITQASLSYHEKNHEEIIFKNIDIDLPLYQWIALLGPSGVGKSAFLRVFAGLIKPANHVAASLVINKPQQIAYMAQADLLLPWLTVLGNATLGLKLRALPKTQHNEEKEKAISLLHQVGLGRAITHYPHQLSGGMRQRTALVRTLMENKPIVLMDEPFSALDAITRYKLQALAAHLLRDKTVLFITHDPAEALRLAHHIYIMQGRPATLKLAAHLTSATPREPDDPHLLALQTHLFHELSQAADVR